MDASSLRSRWLRAALIASAVLVMSAMPAAAHGHLIVGEKGVVANTDGDGANVRSEPELTANVQFVADEGTSVVVTGGPHESVGLTWYSVHVNGIDAWIVSDFLSAVASYSGSQVQVVGTDGHGLRLRSEPSLESTTLTVMPEGATVDVVGDEYTDGAGVTWANIAYGGQTGYAHRGYLAVVGESSEAAVEVSSEPEPVVEQVSTNGISAGGNAQVVDTNGDGLNVRHGAGYGHGVVTVAAEGDVMHVLDGPSVDGDGTNWWNVDYKGLHGWVHGGYVRVTDQPVTDAGSAAGAESSNGGGEVAGSGFGEQLVNTAMQYLGYPYVWGGTTPSGFDCTGFIYYIVNQVTGGGFPRAMEAQVNRGTWVPADQLQPGDLVFQQNTYQWGLSHGGIYIGNGQFIHAANPGSGVIISNMWDSYWGPRYYTARRIS